MKKKYISKIGEKHPIFGEKILLKNWNSVNMNEKARQIRTYICVSQARYFIHWAMIFNIFDLNRHLVMYCLKKYKFWWNVVTKDNQNNNTWSLFIRNVKFKPFWELKWFSLKCLLFKKIIHSVCLLLINSLIKTTSFNTWINKLWQKSSCLPA